MSGKTPYQRIIAASRVGRGVHLSADDVWALAVDGAIEARAELDDAVDVCRKRGYHRANQSGTCNHCEGDVSAEEGAGK